MQIIDTRQPIKAMQKIEIGVDGRLVLTHLKLQFLGEETTIWQNIFLKLFFHHDDMGSFGVFLLLLHVYRSKVYFIN